MRKVKPNAVLVPGENNFEAKYSLRQLVKTLKREGDYQVSVTEDRSYWQPGLPPSKVRHQSLENLSGDNDPDLVYLGATDSPEEASAAYKKFKKKFPQYLSGPRTFLFDRCPVESYRQKTASIDTSLATVDSQGELKYCSEAMVEAKKELAQGLMFSNHPSPGMRSVAGHSLARLASTFPYGSPEKKQLVQALDRLLNDPDDKVRWDTSMAYAEYLKDLPYNPDHLGSIVSELYERVYSPEDQRTVGWCLNKIFPVIEWDQASTHQVMEIFNNFLFSQDPKLESLVKTLIPKWVEPNYDEKELMGELVPRLHRLRHLFPRVEIFEQLSDWEKMAELLGSYEGQTG